MLSYNLHKHSYQVSCKRVPVVATVAMQEQFAQQLPEQAATTLQFPEKESGPRKNSFIKRVAGIVGFLAAVVKPNTQMGVTSSSDVGSCSSLTFGQTQHIQNFVTSASDSEQSCPTTACSSPPEGKSLATKTNPPMKSKIPNPIWNNSKTHKQEKKTVPTAIPLPFVITRMPRPRQVRKKSKLSRYYGIEFKNLEVALSSNHGV